MIKLVGLKDVLADAHRSLGLLNRSATDDTYLAAIVRRLAGTVCPCSPKTLIRAGLETHRGLVADDDALAEQLERVIDDLVAIGDLLELSDVVAIDEKIKGTWLFAAPPGFVIHLGEVAHIVGLSADEQTPLPASVRDRVTMQGVSRRIFPFEGEDLRPLLSELGLREISSEAWLRHPKAMTANELIARADNRLASQGKPGPLEDVRIFNTVKGHRSYRTSWEKADRQTGKFIIRRAQGYGADRWGYADVADGRVERLLEFPDFGERWRGCDVAWRLLLAQKAILKENQTYRCTTSPEVGQIDFFMPLPDWARRSLYFTGSEVAPRSCLLSFDVPLTQLPAVERFLSENLFLLRQTS